ncbi:unnamed protein product, partial [Polarella glacialis]
RTTTASASVVLPIASSSGGGSDGQRSSEAGAPDPLQSELLATFDKAIAAAVARGRLTAEDAHHAPALRKAKKSVIDSLKQGDNLSLSALHTLKGVGHWVVEQLRLHLPGTAGAPGRVGGDGKRRRVEAPPTPNSFQWWYLNRKGERVETRNDAEFTGPANDTRYRVSLLHSSGRLEKAWLPDAKAPPRSQGAA